MSHSFVLSTTPMAHSALATYHLVLFTTYIHCPPPHFSFPFLLFCPSYEDIRFFFAGESCYREICVSNYSSQLRRFLDLRVTLLCL